MSKKNPSRFRESFANLFLKPDRDFAGNDTGISARRVDIPGASPSALPDEKAPFVIDAITVIRVIVLALLLILFCLMQTTFFTRFRPFGAVPDLILPLVVAVAVTLKEKWGAVFALIAAYVIESLSGSAVTLMPIFYVLVAYICGLLSVYYFRNSFAVLSLYTLATSFLKAVITLIIVLTTVGVDFPSAMTKVVLPELLVNILFAALPHLVVALTLRPLSKQKQIKA